MLASSTSSIVSLSLILLIAYFVSSVRLIFPGVIEKLSNNLVIQNFQFTFSVTSRVAHIALLVSKT
jgi:hypothetical protein